ncbi:hypothetical protein B0T22DRAFT_427716 [Podospora appendiculata]|uniref:Uncharacterized protein n=1 Tax=Podospora appendiculata TaxID=314037 RepID=A0AAE0XBK1_9PEZI|nr:hypothetical protein B0T22DRAFT_427716 [Podospora appendiculata]
MFSKIKTLARRRQPRKTVLEGRKENDSSLLQVRRETQIQPYVEGELAIISAQSNALDETDPKTVNNTITTQTTSYTLVVAEHEAPSSQPEPITPPTQSINFLEWLRFDEATLPPRENLSKSRLDKVFSPLDKIKAELPGGVSVEGLGGLAESVHALFHSVKRLDFMQSERAIRIPQAVTGAAPEPLPRTEVERLENELFDLTRYNGACEYLTALAWAEEGLTGSITLFEVQLAPAARRDMDDVAVGVRPVAAMQNVPKSVLASMRAHDKIKRKVVFVPTDEDATSFKWRANPSSGPSYVKLTRDDDDEESQEQDHNRREASAHSHRSHSHSHNGSRLADADGIRATIPQFLALLHAKRAILEDVESSSVAPLEIDEGDVVAAVKLVKQPRPNSHEGDNVHVVVLMPNEASWADEQIVWTDADGLVEFRRRRFWDLIESEMPAHGRRSSGGRHQERSGSRRRSSHGLRESGGSGSGSRPRSTSRHSSSGRRSRTRSPSRHLSPQSVF